MKPTWHCREPSARHRDSLLTVPASFLVFPSRLSVSRRLGSISASRYSIILARFTKLMGWSPQGHMWYDLLLKSSGLNQPIKMIGSGSWMITGHFNLTTISQTAFITNVFKSHQQTPPLWSGPRSSRTPCTPHSVQALDRTLHFFQILHQNIFLTALRENKLCGDSCWPDDMRFHSILTAAKKTQF